MREALRRSLPILFVVSAVAVGVSLRVRFLRHEMMSRWQVALEGGALTTQATVDEWFSDRKADAEALATCVAINAAFPRAGDPASPFSTVLAPIVRRAKFTDAWVVDSSGGLIAGASKTPLQAEEIQAAREAIASGRTQHSSVATKRSHSATMVIASPVTLRADAPRVARSPAAIIVRADLVEAFAPWARGRPILGDRAARPARRSPSRAASPLHLQHG